MTNYPNQIDTNAELPAVHDNISEVSTELLNALRETLITVETTLGLNPQGAATDLVTRLGVALNADGTIKDSALPSTLIDLPITNAQIGASAAIEESKLDLDVSTQILQNQITSNDTDIANLQASLASLLLRYVRHVTGADERHASGHIDHTLIDGYVLGAGTTVKTALNFLSGQMDLHRKEPEVWQHFASAVRYIPTTTEAGGTPVITATNVQDAITGLETDFIEDRRKHNDEAHNDGVSNDGYIALGGQVAINDASLKLTRYQPPSVRDVTKIGLCNTAVIKSKGFDPTALNANDSALNIEAKIGGVARTISLTGLQTTVYPLGVTQKSLSGVVDLLNAKFSDTGNHFPLTAFESEDGEIVIQHNLARIDSTITIRDPGAISAVNALGFTDLVDVEVGRFQNFAYLINGIRYTELETLADGYSTHVFPATTIVDLGITVDSTGLDLKPGGLIHIYNHDGYESNGTYQIQGVGTTTVELTEALANGGFRFVIYGDTLDTTDFTGAQRAALDFYLDKEREPVTSTRANITYNSTDGFRIVEISQNFPDFAGGFFNVTGTTTKTVELEDSSGNKGVAVSFEPGFIGYLRIYAPDNTSFITIFVYKVTVANGTVDLNIFETEANDDRLLLGTGHVDAASNEVEIPLNRLNVGLVAEQSIGSEFKRNVLERDVRNYHVNGVVRGFDILSTTSNTVRVEGGQAYIDGRLVDRSTTPVDVDTSNTGTFNLVLTKQGNYNIFEEGVGSGNSFSVAEIIVSDDNILVAQIVVSDPGGGNQVTDTVDGRLFVNDIENKLQLTVDDRDLGAGTFRSLESAVLYSANVPNDTKPEITILSDLTVPDALTITSVARIVAFGDVTVQDDLTLSSGANLTVFGTFTASGSNTVTIGTGGTLNLEGPSVFGGSLVLSNDSVLHFGDSATMTDPILTGDRCFITGTQDKPTITFPGTDDGITIDDGYVTVRDLDFQMTNGVGVIGQKTIINLTSGGSFLRVDSCDFSQTGAVDEGNWADPFNDAFRIGIGKLTATTIEGVSITKCNFRNLYTGINLSLTDDILIDGCTMANQEFGINLTTSKRSRVSNSSFRKIRDTYVNVGGGTASSVYINNNIFREEFKPSAPPTLIDLGAAQSVITENQFIGIRVDTGIDISDGMVAFEGNMFDSCISESHLISAGNSAGDVNKRTITSNYMHDHQGQIFVGNNVIMSDNFFEVVDIVGAGTSIITMQADSSNVQSTIGNNVFVFDTAAGANTTTIDLLDGLIQSNFITVGSIEVAPGGISPRDFIISNNNILMENGSLEILETKDGTVIISSNDIKVGGNFIALNVNDTSTPSATKVIIINGNNFESTSSNTITVRVGTSGITSDTRWLLNSNTVRNGSSRGIEVFASNVSITDNITLGSSGIDIFMDSAAENLYVTDNQVGNATITHGSSTPTNVYIGPNKGAETRLAIPVFHAFIDGYSSGWEIGADALLSDGSGVTDPLYFPLTLPVGVEIVTVEPLISANAASSVSVELFTRTASATLSSLGTAATPGGHGINFLTLTPTSTTYIRTNQEYFLKISSITAGDQLYQVVATIKY